MGLLDPIAGALGQQPGGSGQTNQLMQLALNLINSHPGGLQGLVQLGEGAKTGRAYSTTSCSPRASILPLA